MSYMISNGVLNAHLRFCITDNKNRLVICSFFERSKAVVVGIASALMVEGSNHRGNLEISQKGAGTRNNRVMSAYTPYGESYEASYTHFLFDKDRANLAMIFSSEVGNKYLLTTKEWLEDDFYSCLISRYELPLLREWVPYILQEMRNRRDLFSMESKCVATEGSTLNLKGVDVPVTDIMVVSNELNQELLGSIITKGLRSGAICISKKPQKALNLGEDNKSLDMYMTNYGSYLQKNVEEVIKPLVPLMDKVEGFVTKSKRPYPQQSAIINGAIALKRSGARYAMLNCGMGCGKTIMGIGTVEGYHNQNWLKAHPGKTLKDMYLSNDQPTYRVIVMPPGHLVEKWRREILKEVPGAKATILNNFSQLVELRERGKKPTGREWYILSKDFCKLGSADAPIPVNMGYQYIEVDYCLECYNNDGEVVRKVTDKRGRGICPRCGERKHFTKMPLIKYGKKRGLVCPSCNRLLLGPSAKLDGDGEDSETQLVLQPYDFSSKKAINAFCSQCRAPLWGSNCKPVGTAAPKSKWYKVSHFSNWSRKNKKTAWVLKNHEYGYFRAADIIDARTGSVYPEMEVQKCRVEYSSRKVAPATYIKKYLKGYFDFCILDECHKYSGAGTAQSMAAHALVKTSKYTIGLTGTLTNGKADSIYYLLWMLEPRKMVEKGFSYGSPMEFSKQYGCVEAVYEAGFSGEYRSVTKGRQISAPKAKPGINPLVYREFLLAHAENMDLADMTRYMPPLREYVEVIPLPKEVHKAYVRASNVLNEAIKDDEGGCLMGETLNFCLSYPDKPYGRSVIMHPRFKNAVVLNPPECSTYKSALLPKEERIVSIIRNEISENRNVFVFANFTGKEESNVTGRLKAIIEHECSLDGRVDVLRADTPEALKREAYIHERAKAGVRVVITNAKVCETGLDFCFEEDGVFYNYPTIIFAQPTYELATMMQASRRHYRLNQTEECRTYWMAYEDTLQTAALQIMASKQVAASAIQGRFSAEGLASMAQGVDPRVMLAKKLSDGDNSSREELNSMFDVLARSNLDEEEDYTGYKPPLLYFELMGEHYQDEVSTGEVLPTIFSVLQEFPSIQDPSIQEKPAVVVPFKPKQCAKVCVGQFHLLTGEEKVIEDTTVVPFDSSIIRSKRKVKMAVGQLSLF